MSESVLGHASSPRVQSFGRFEFKYILSTRLSTRIEAEIMDFMEVDPFCRDLPTRDYLVRSLYYDDPSFAAYYQKIDGVSNRSKYRLRTYGRDASGPVFLEIKGRTNHYSYKHRTPLAPDLLARVQAQDWMAVLAAAPDNEILTQFVHRVLRRNLHPRVVVEYARRPYVATRDYRFRATFDRQLVAGRSATWNGQGGYRQPVLWDRSVLEIKFEQVVPVWFQRLIGAFQLQRVSISKYCRAAEALGLVVNLE